MVFHWLKNLVIGAENVANAVVHTSPADVAANVVSDAKKTGGAVADVGKKVIKDIKDA